VGVIVTVLRQLLCPESSVEYSWQQCSSAFVMQVVSSIQYQLVMDRWMDGHMMTANIALA